MTAFDPWPPVALHADWGLDAACLAVERRDAVVVVDALSFSTTVVMAAARGADVLPLPRAILDEAGDHTVIERRFGAKLLANDPVDRLLADDLIELSDLRPGDRVVVPSQNGGTLCAAVSQAPAVAVGSFRNRAAVAEWCAMTIAAATARRVTLIAAGSVWSQMTPLTALRPCIEDGLAAGAIASAARALGLDLSVEAAALATLFDSAAERYDLETWLHQSVTGRWLASRGDSQAEIRDAVLVDHDDVVPALAPDRFFRPHVIRRNFQCPT
ncbi:2-phosphosulfolactate phosphatase [Mycobacterium sp. pW049]|uniref:2-phosphosulfolactate phosphatase n=1 Tax=[Mycobacterium] bulgaricum TaxID=3238985 RepID=UPI00351ABDE9